MREIKFRAWGIGEDKKGFMFNWEPFSKSISEWIGNEETGIILMQYTGLKDKNGKEIYEGDIIQTPTPKDLKPFKFFWRVFWGYSEDDYGYGWRTKTNVENREDWLSKEVAKQGEVIGNIYEKTQT